MLRFYLSNGIETTIKSHFWHVNIKICHYVSNVVIDVTEYVTE